VVLVLCGLLFLCFWLIPTAASALTDLWFFREIGYQGVFTTQLVTQLLLFLIVCGLSIAFLWFNLMLAQQGIAPVPFVVPVGGNAAGMINVTALVRQITPIAAIVIGVMIASGTVGSWELVLQALHPTPFGITDPVFGRDIGFYVFTLPALDSLLALLRGLVLLALIVLVPIYRLRRDILLVPPRRLRIEPGAARHLAILLAAFFALGAVQIWFVDLSNLLYSDTGPLVGASYTDLHATMPMLRLSAFLAVGVAAAILVGHARGALGRWTAWSVGIYAAVVLVGRGLFPAVMQKLVVAPTELTRERPYLRNHIVATRAAWGLDSVQVKDLDDVGTLTQASIAANAATIDNVRLWDRDPLLQTFSQLQEIRTYYNFASIDDDRYWIDGKYRQVLLSPRELNAAALPTRTFINEHLTFTHGMGLTMAPVNQVTDEGLPVLFIKDLPPVSTVSLKITRPQVYYGEAEYDYAVVGTKEKEFDHPVGDQNVFDSYQGTGGVGVGNVLRRLVFSVALGTSKIFFSGDITDQSRVLYYRNIRDRVTRALPFLAFDHDPYLVIAADGTLKWLLDGYTSTDRYPYAARASDGTTYMRNSVKVVIDAYNGSLVAYVSAPHDPLIETWSRIFPGIFHAIGSMPSDLRAHLRVPDELYRQQTRLYTTYHMDAPDDFYQRNDQWQIPAVDESTGAVPFMRHIIMRLPGEKQAEYIYMVPFTQRGKDNLSAWMVARNDGAEYGKLVAYRLPRQSLVYGPSQVEARINQDTDISRQLSLWDQRGSKVVRGDLLVIPIEQSLLYVQPLYLQADKGRIPELKRVVVVYGDRVVMDETLDAALATLFGGAPTGAKTPTAAETTGQVAPPAAGASTTMQGQLLDARRHFQAALDAQRNGDWARYGEEIKALGAILDQVRPPAP
jgi:hypothetical protein